ncbi:TonB-dependent receptor [Pseudoxanthomonas sp. J35]|uniref:TonB-dependent receptor n=1 Tax=Pseudoxanthomonas sp. J35 TaxID=935852 RepID=UPI00048E892C|nr:TonB-dependent receptor [Pseudoxanthomonas sp. J35]
MLNLQRNLLSAALASAILLTAQGAHAQAATATAAQDETTQLDTVVVTGIRRGIEGAISTKRDSSSIVEAISAEDIGKLPDVSIAESIARLPGLAAQRVAGRAQVISVRGLSPDFSTTLLNGREMVSTGDNRSVEFDQYPSELVNGVTVYKTPDAGLVGQGLSGTVDMRTIRPLAHDGSAVMVGGRYQRNSLGSAANADADGHRLNATWIGKFADDTFGIALGYSHSNTPIQENQVGLYEPWQQLGDGWRPGVPAGTWYSDGAKALRRTGYTDRDGVMATLQFRPSNAWTSTLDLFYTRAEQEDTANQFEVHLGGYNGGFDPGLELTGVTVNGNGSFTGGVAHNVYPLVRGMYNKRDDRIKAFGWTNEFNAGSVEVVADIGWSKSTREELNLENNTQLYPMPQLDSVAIDFRSNGFSRLVPGLDYSNPAALFLNNTIYGSGYGKVPSVDDELKTFRLSASIPAGGWFADVDVGLNYADREKDKVQPEGNINLGAQGPVAIGQDLQYGLVKLGFAGIGYIPSWNVPAAVARYMSFEPVDDLDYLISKAWTVNEKITTGYARANLDTEWGGLPVTGNIGFQVQHVDQSSSSNYWDGSQPAGSQVIPIEKGKTYTDVLPSLNLAFSFDHEQMLRVALARQVARPRVDQLRSSMEFGVDTANLKPGASGGNPELDPWRANAFDISYEKYFGTKAYVAAAYFYKDLRSYIYTQTRDDYDFTPQVAAWMEANAGTLPPGTVVQNTGNFTAPFNGRGGSLQGLELTASLPLDLFSDTLAGFGIVASASFFDSDIEILDPDSASSVGSDPITLPGLSDRVYNWTLYYERNGFEARVNQRRRSDFIGEIGNFNGNRTLRYVVGENITDAQVSYTFSSGSLAGMTLLLQGSNLTNEAYRTYAGSKDRPLEYIEWGRTILFGVNYRF